MEVGETSLDRPTRATQRGYIATLDGWRAIAIGLVISSHSIPMLQNNGSRPALLLATLFEHQGYGVDIFFALSGFLITTLLLRERSRTGSISLKRFYVRRFFRIIPPIVCYLASFYILLQTGIIAAASGHDFLGSLLFARNYVYGSWYTGHFWSLSIEEHFYAVIPVLILFRRPHALLTTCLGLIAACIAIRAFEFSNEAWFEPLPQFRTENRVDGLLWGSIVAQLCQRPAVLGWLRKTLTWWKVLTLLIATIACLIVFDDHATRRTIAAAVLPWIIWYTVENPTGVFGLILESSLFKALGRISYSLYIWQMMFLVPGTRSLGPFQDFPLNLIASFVLAYLSFRWVEAPMIRIGHHVADTWWRPSPSLVRASPRK
jgi:peptidoglycan/LPS O-acetylase OafA/YrhL